MSDERRARYAAAIVGRFADLQFVADDLARVVMAVADAEMGSVHRALDEERDIAVRAEAENTRLRCELQALHATLEDARLDVDYYREWAHGSGKSLTEARHTISRVRDVLNYDPGWSPAEFARRIRAALEGGPDV